MERKLKAQAMGSVGELPAGYLHLPTTPIKQEPELTDWISGDLKPVRDGVYQRKYNHVDGFIYAKFKRGYWHCWSHTVESANQSVLIAADQNLKWRGLSSNPNEVQS